VSRTTNAAQQLKLLKQVADVNDTDESWTLMRLSSRPALVQLAIEKGADVNKRTPAKAGSMTALIEIAKSITGDREAGQQKSLQLLIDAKAELDARDADGQTALFHAVLVENLRFAKILIAAGADPNVPNSDGNSVLDDLLTWGRLDDKAAAKLIKVLLASKKWKKPVLERAKARATANGWPASAKLIG